MKLLQIFETEEAKTDPTKIVSEKWRTNGDGSSSVRIERANGSVIVHTNKNLRVLEKLVKDRYRRKG